MNIDRTTVILNKLVCIEQKLTKLDEIQDTVKGVITRLNEMHGNVETLNQKVLEMEKSRDYDAKCVTEITKKQEEIATLLEK